MLLPKQTLQGCEVQRSQNQRRRRCVCMTDQFECMHSARSLSGFPRLWPNFFETQDLGVFCFRPVARCIGGRDFGGGGEGGCFDSLSLFFSSRSVPNKIYFLDFSACGRGGGRFPTLLFYIVRVFHELGVGPRGKTKDTRSSHALIGVNMLLYTGYIILRT